MNEARKDPIIPSVLESNYKKQAFRLRNWNSGPREADTGEFLTSDSLRQILLKNPEFFSRVKPFAF
jgi:hypothetical protein